MAVLISTAVFCQSRINVSGLVTDAANGECLIGAEIVCGEDGVTTDSYGHYSIAIESGVRTLLCYYSGYTTNVLELSSCRDTVINVSMKAGARLEASRVIAGQETNLLSTHIDALDISPEAVRKTPVLFGEADVLKTAQLIPGVQGGMEGFSGLFVRGGGSDENLFLLDGVVMYNVSHLLGVFSSFTPEAIKKATLYKGAFPSRYGGRVSGVLDLRTIDGDLYKLHGSFSAGLIASKVHLNGPIIKGKTSFAISGRLMHTAVLAPVVKLSGNTFAYYFYDMNGKLVHRFSDSDRLFFTVYHGKDVFDYESTDDTGITVRSHNKYNLDWGSTVAALRWLHVSYGRWTTNASLAFNRFGMNTNIELSTRWEEYIDKRLQFLTENSSSIFNSDINDLSFCFDASCNQSNKLGMKLGTSIIHHHFAPSRKYIISDSAKSEPISEESYDTEYAGWEAALYSENEIKFSGNWSANLGLRFVMMTSGTIIYPSVQPRVSVQWTPGRSLSMKAGYARMGQYVHQLSSSRITLPSDLWVPITSDIRPVVSDIGSVGAFYTGLPGWKMSIESYYKFSQNVIDYKDGASMFGSSAGWESLVEMGQARSYGIELFVKYAGERLEGSVAYTLSKSERCYLDGYINNGKWFPDRYDRRHVVNLSLNYVFSEKMDVGARWFFASGGWLTVPDRTIVLLDLDEETQQNYIGKEEFLVADYISARNNYRLPPSHMLNLAVNFNRKLRHGDRTICISVYNTYNAMNPNLVYTKGRSVGERIILEKLTFLPVLPAFNYTYRF